MALFNMRELRASLPRFQRLMDEVLPDWRERRAALNERPPSRFPGDAAG